MAIDAREPARETGVAWSEAKRMVGLGHAHTPGRVALACAIE